MNNRETLLRNGSAVVSLIDVNPQGHHRVPAIRFIATEAIPRTQMRLRTAEEKNPL